ncbi:MAG: tetratricopeptide repeat protein [Paludibacter sp.]|nr:tetratricopeptide repeat protein [Bacteroidales bacterium]MCM1068796.1 tetratricopeptide repeat protein [Prevotella sp.]MCM1353937.1 tetratricopeptide repeat protein [Bacteroides sp.]MCM1443335.1 tetratricopeptide repeat protein [Muribaculum sp.]MCM1482124.1 tetratricopeptide repeat protein [Paludibacter sp.]
MAQKAKQDENLENVQEALTASGSWIIKHQNAIMWTILAILAVVLAIMAFHNYYLKPKGVEADNAVGMASAYFAAKDYETALNGDDNDCIGFAAIADDYSYTKAGKVAALYAGICYYNLEQYEEAVKYLGKFDADDLNIASAAKQKQGDAYVALGEFKKAVKCFEDAADSKNEIIAPISLKKAGIAYLELGDKKAARKAFQSIKDNYPTSAEAQDIEKYIANIAD